MLINNAVITGSFIVNGVDVVGITGSAAISSSFLALSSSYVITSASYAQSSASLSIRTSNLEATSSTLISASSSFAAQSASFSSRVNIIEGQDATTGSNTFTGVQYISQASNAISFTSTASLYTDGGFRVAKDSFVSGTAYFNNIVVYGTSSIEYITSSQVDIGANIITVNTDTPAVRFGGLSVFDSGSTQLTGSMLWDSETNHWVYSNPSGSSYSGGMIMSGPRSSALGSEQGTTNNALMKGQGGDHITSSQVIDDGTTVRIPGNLQVTGSTILASTLTGTSAAFTGSMNVSGSFIVTTTAPELQVGATGVTLGNVITDTHNITGSVRISGSLAGVGATFSSSVTAAGITSTGTNTMLSISSSTAGLVVRGGSSIGTPALASGQILIGQTTAYRLSLAYDDNTGYAYIDNLYDNANSNIYFRVRTNGTPINALTLFGTGAATFSSSGQFGGTLSSQVSNGGADGGILFVKNSAGATLNSTAVLAFATDSGGTATNNPRIQAILKNTGNGASDLEFFVHSGAGVINKAFTLFRDSTATFSSSVTASGLYAITSSEVRLYNANNTNWGTIKGSTDTTNGSISLTGGSGNGMIISNGGNVGIGTSSPLGPLEVRAANRAVDTDGILQVNTTNSQSADLGGSLTFGGVWTSTSVTEWAAISGRKENSTAGNYAGYLSFATRPMGGANTERMRITSGGVVNVLNDLGVGTASPSGKIHGVGINTSGSNNVLYLENAVATIMFQVRNDGNIRVNSTVFNNTTAGTTRTIFVGDGGYFLGGISSIRASKKNIKEFDSKWIYDLKPVEFNYRKKDEDGNYTEEIYEEVNYGLIAEDTAQVADFLINYDNKEDETKDMVGIEYSRLITPMLKAIQELKAELDTAKTEINELKNK